MLTATTDGSDLFHPGVSLFQDRRIAEAVTYFQEAGNKGHGADTCSSYLWQCWMLLGEFENAWRESDLISTRSPQSLWDGLPFDGKRVVVRCLHGYGDAIQFLRYASLIRQSAARVIVETHPELVQLFKGMPGVDSVVTWANPGSLDRKDWDQQLEVMELPSAFRTTLSTIPARVPYLRVSRRARQKSGLYFRAAGKPKIGILWASGTWNPARSLRLRDFLPILDPSAFSLYSFQRGPAREELHELPVCLKLHDTAEHSPGIHDTAADLLNLDLLITPDTMAAHLAGALGVPVWTLLPRNSDWRWMLDRDDSPWYPTMRLFRQPTPGDWASVINSVAAALRP